MTDYPETIIYTEEEGISCMGEAMDHPKVYYAVPEEGFVKCNYCDIKFLYVISIHYHILI